MPTPGYSHKIWKDQPDHTTPISAAALEDLEDRVTQFAFDTASALSGSFKGVWNSGTAYSLGNGVSVGATNYISTVAGVGTNTNHNPVGDDGSHWTPAIPSSVVSGSSPSGDKYGRTKVMQRGDGARGQLADLPSVLDFGAKCDGVFCFGGVPSGSATFTSVVSGISAATFYDGSDGVHPTDVGKLVLVQGAGAAGADLLTTISAVSSNGSHVCTLAATAGTTVTFAQMWYATDDLAAINAAIAALVSTAAPPVIPVGGILTMPPGYIGLSSVLDLGVIGSAQLSQLRSLRIQGAGANEFTSVGQDTTTLLSFQSSGPAVKSYATKVTGLHLRDFGIRCLMDIGAGNFALDWSNVGSNSSIKRVRVFGRGNGAQSTGTRPNVGNGVRIDNPGVGQIVLEDVVAQKFDAPATVLAPPTGFTATPVVGGGTFAAATYFWVITARNAAGETLASTEVSAAIALNGSCNLAWSAVTGANGYKIYRATTTGGQFNLTTGGAPNNQVTVIGSGATVAFTDTGAAPGAGVAPATNTAFTYPGSEGFRFGSELPGPGGANGDQAGNIKLGALRSECTVGFRFKAGSLFNSASADALKAVMSAKNTTLSNGGALTLPAATIPVVSTTPWTNAGVTSGKLIIYDGASNQVVTFTNISGNSFTGCSGGTGSIADGSSIYEPTPGSIGYWFDGANQQSHTINAPHSEEYRIPFWFNGSQGMILTAPWAEIPGSSTKGDGSVAFAFDNTAYANKVDRANVGGAFGGFDVVASFRTAAKANALTHTVNGSVSVYSATYRRNGLNSAVDLSQIGWQKPSLVAGFSDGAGVSGSPEFGLFEDGIVRGRGLVLTNGAKAANTAMFTLPAALIPPNDHYIVVFMQLSLDPNAATSDVGVIQVMGAGQGGNAGKVRNFSATNGAGNISLSRVEFTLEPQV